LGDACGIIAKGQTAGPNSGNYTESFMEKITLSTQLVNAILQYLGNQPFVQVQQLINGIQQEAQAQAAPALPAEVPAEE
jgi:hypothetical protein